MHVNLRKKNSCDSLRFKLCWVWLHDFFFRKVWIEIQFRGNEVGQLFLEAGLIPCRGESSFLSSFASGLIEL